MDSDAGPHLRLHAVDSDKVLVHMAWCWAQQLLLLHSALTCDGRLGWSCGCQTHWWRMLLRMLRLQRVEFYGWSSFIDAAAARLTMGCALVV